MMTTQRNWLTSSIIALVALVVVAGLIGALFPEFHRIRTVRNLPIGISKQMVLEELGEPDDSFGESQWVYDLYWGQGWAKVRFDSREEVHVVDIESPFDGL